MKCEVCPLRYDQGRGAARRAPLGASPVTDETETLSGSLREGESGADCKRKLDNDKAGYCAAEEGLAHMPREERAGKEA